MAVRRALSAVRRAVSQPVDVEDPASLDPELVRACAPVVDAACRAWFDLDVRGLDRVPDGGALLVGNHNSGTTFLEMMGVGARWYTQRGTDQRWHGLAHDAIVDLPGLGRLMARIGAMRAGHETAARAFASGGKVVVFPGGNREAFRPYRRRHRVEFYGRRGFVRLALRHRVPIVPMVNIGGHEGFYVWSAGESLARRLPVARWIRSDTWPVVVGLPWGVSVGPWFHVPLPVPCVTEFLEPIDTARYGEGAHSDADAQADLYDRVLSAMQSAMDRLAAERAASPGLGLARRLGM